MRLYNFTASQVDKIPPASSNRVTRPHTSSRPQGGRPSANSTRSSRGSPDDNDGGSEPPPATHWGQRDPWALSFVDRAPLLWRSRALRCRLLEIREGVDR
jgi:hypothetical protein